MAGLLPLGRYLYGRISWLVFLEERREAERLRNDKLRIELLLSHMRLCESVLTLMKTSGASSTEIKAVMREIVVARVRWYVLAESPADAQVLNFKQPARLKERRSSQLKALDKRHGRRAGDAG